MEHIQCLWTTAVAAAAEGSMLCLCGWPVAGVPHTNMDIDILGNAGLHPATPDQRDASWSCSSGAAAVLGLLVMQRRQQQQQQQHCMCQLQHHRQSMSFLEDTLAMLCWCFC
jgi:hypothetical protein